MSAKVSQATLRGYELREAKTWRAAGWLVQETWKKAVYIGAGRLITKPTDFFDAFDLIAVHPDRATVAFIQVTASPFVKARDGKADRNAAHGEPPFAWGLGYPYTVDEFMVGSSHRNQLATVIVSWAEARNPERRWWTRTPTP